jgi:predicted MPP superfamily phosphohydrolase
VAGKAGRGRLPSFRFGLLFLVEEGSAVQRRRFLGWAAGATGLIGLGGYAYGFEPHWVEVCHRSLPIARLPQSLAGARLVQISDLHVGARVDDGYLVDCLARVRSLQPDLLVLTGDILDFRSDRDEAQYGQLRDVLSHLPRARLATIAVLGNHDYGTRWSQPHVAQRVAEELGRAGALVLRNECVSIQGLDVVGVDDLMARRADPAAALARRSSPAALALCHNPDTLDARPWLDYTGFVLAGHTHGGQCRLPFLPPLVVPVRNRRYAAGEVAVPGGRTLYVNRGLGHLLRVRFNARPEITAFTLTRA